MGDNELSRNVSTSQPRLEVSTSNQVNSALSTQSLNNQSYESAVRNTFGSDGGLSHAAPADLGSSNSENKMRNSRFSHEKIRNDVDEQGQSDGVSNWRNITRSDESSIHNQTDAGLWQIVAGCC